MSLFGIMQLSSNALNAASLGMQVTGNNIANASTPDYIRQRLIQSPQPGVQTGNLIVGLGVRIEGIQQVIDKFLNERLRGATSDVASSDALADAYTKLEFAINELGDQDLSTALTTFFGSLQNVLNQPESLSVRNVAVQKARALTEVIHRLDGQVRAIYESVNNEIMGLGGEINDLLAEVAELNVEIAHVEGGGTSLSDAVGLRDRRGAALARLAEITDIKTVEQPTGDVTVYSNGDFLVSLGTYRTVSVVTDVQDGLQVSRIQIDETNAPLTAGGGRLEGLKAARDDVLRGFLTGLDNLTKSLIFEFNKVHASGQGLTGFSDVTGEHAVTSTTAALDAAGLTFSPSNGLFQVLVYNTQTGQRTTTDVRVDLNGLDTDTSLQALAADLDAIAGIGATITADGELRITSDSAQTTFAFADDTSGVLAALGINTFFSGTGSQDIGVSHVVSSDPKKLAIARGGVGEDSANGELLANLLTTPLAAEGGLSLTKLYDRLTNNVGLGSQSASAAAEGFRHFQQ